MKSILKLLKGAGWLNLLGMSVAFAAIYIILVQVNYDYNYNKGIKDADRIYLAATTSWFDEGKYQFGLSRPNMEECMASAAQIETYGACRIQKQPVKVKFGQNKNGDAVQMTYMELTTKCMQVWGFEPAVGSFEGMATECKVAVSESAAQKYHIGLGDVIWMETFSNAPQTVCAIFKDLSANSDVWNVDVLTCRYFENQGLDTESEWSYNYFVKLKDAADKVAVEENFYHFFKEEVDKQLAVMDEKPTQAEIDATIYRACPKLFPLTEVHFDQRLENYPNAGNKTTTITLFVIACLILLITLINYVNFFMAQVPVKLCTVNTRKILGSTRSALMFRFLAESGVLVLLALVLSCLWVLLMKDSSLSHLLSCPLDFGQHMGIVAITIGVALLLTLASSLYPAWYITSFPPALALKGMMGAVQRGKWFRYGLIGFQFVVTFGFLISAVFVKLQYEYMMHFDMGFDKENLFNAYLPVTADNQETFANELRKRKEIKDIAWSDGPLVNTGHMGWGREFKGENISFTSYPVSVNFLKFMGIDIVEGRDFMPSDDEAENGVMIFNQQAKTNFGLTLEDKVHGHRGETEIVGFCDDFSFKPLKYANQPFAFYVFGKHPWRAQTYLYLRSQPGVMYADLEKVLKEVTAAVMPGYNTEEVQLTFFDDNLRQRYWKEQQLVQLLSLFTFVAIVISLMGIIGLLTLETAFRKKEIGVRRVYGATIGEILSLFCQRYLKILVASFVISVPIAYYAMNIYYSTFAYRAPLHWWVFALAFLAVLLVTVTVVTFCCYKAASINPAESIKNE